ncbi:MAG: fasciclin domain-containing protein [Nitrososphaerales archaeon]
MSSTTTTTIRTETTTQTNMSNILDASKSTGEFKTLMQAVEKAGLTDTLRSNGPYTVFAPTDEAFKNLPVGTVDGWMRDLPKLRSVLNYHIVDRKITAKDIQEMTLDGRTPSLKTLQGSPITLKTNLTQQSWIDSKHSVYANDAKLVRPEIVTGNGIIQVVDRVLLPVS